METTTFIQSIWLFNIALLLGFFAVPDLRRAFLTYGPRGTSPPGQRQSDSKAQEPKSLLDTIASVKVPHSWFLHFYVVSVLSSVLWLHQVCFRGPLYQAIISRTSLDRPSMSFNQLVLCWSLLTIHGARRTYESIVLVKSSRSKIGVGQYIIGILFYVTLGIAMWIEGAPALSATQEPIGDALISAPSLSTMVFLPVFLLASGIQHDAHCYLNSLKKYTLPSHPAFARIIAPHYTAEYAIYLAFTFLAAPEGRIVNNTLLTFLAFTVLNLGITADASKNWYSKKFGAARMESRWRVLPGIW